MSETPDRPDVAPLIGGSPCVPTGPASGGAPRAGTPDPAWLAHTCYCGDPRSEHARNAGPCLVTRDGTRCGCPKFEHPSDQLDPARTLDVPPRIASRPSRRWLCTNDQCARAGTLPVFLPHGVPAVCPGCSAPLAPADDDPEAPAGPRTLRARRSAHARSLGLSVGAVSSASSDELEDPVIRHLRMVREAHDIHDRLVGVETAVERVEAAVREKSDEWGDAIVDAIRTGLGTDVHADRPAIEETVDRLDTLVSVADRGHALRKVLTVAWVTGDIIAAVLLAVVVWAVANGEPLLQGW